MKVLRVSLRLTLIAISFAAILPVCGAAARAQQPAVASDMNGAWINVDPATRGIVRIEVIGKKIRPWGSCHPDLCDWGWLKAKSFTAAVDSSSPTALQAKQHTGFSRSEITLSVERGGKLRAEVFTHFTDGSGRADYRTVNLFARNTAAYLP